MNKTLLLAMSMSCAFAFCGCDDEENSAPTVTDTPIVLSGKAYTFDPELEGEIWKRGKSVGVYMKRKTPWKRYLLIQTLSIIQQQNLWDISHRRLPPL